MSGRVCYFTHGFYKNSFNHSPYDDTLWYFPTCNALQMVLLCSRTGDVRDRFERSRFPNC
ncbi:hypothetical protein X777_06417 [Ooceraea biroi]|uniref:Uncharacterized protein n=1 Tax=Ooceraea biroi TaxID=2015173 RepID=A0A026WBK1_OOCBI|nr:hypothetical protein X777_06417 [Ooceraea biroi]